MSRNKTKLAATIVAAAAMALSFLAVSSVASATTVNWKGVTFETQGQGTASVESGTGDLLLTPTDNNFFALHVNRLPGGGSGPSFVNDNDTPFIRFSYFDTGVASQKIDVSVQDEPESGSPRVEAGSLFSAGKVASATYGNGSAERDANEEYSFFDGPRANVEHDVVLGRAADGTLYIGFDGELHSSDIFKDAGLDFDFNDVLLRTRSVAGSTVRFTDLTYGDDFSPNLQAAVPEPGSLAMLGLGCMLLLFFGLARRSRG